MGDHVNAKVRYVNSRTWVCNACNAQNDHTDGECQFCDADHTCYVRGTTAVREGIPPHCDDCGKPMLDYWTDGNVALAARGAKP
jgi:hypothetical protein